MKNDSPTIISQSVVQFQDVSDFLAVLERTGQTIYLSNSCRCQRYTVHGVPGSRLDVLVDYRLTDCEAPDLTGRQIVCQIVKKSGRFDGAERPRITFRVAHATSIKQQATVRFSGYVTDDTTGAGKAFVELVPTTDEEGEQSASDIPLWTWSGDTLRSKLNHYDPQSIVMWHWTRYYQVCVPHDAAVQLAATWAAMLYDQNKATWSLSEANRSASRMLYQAARDAGWRKLTRRERTQLGIPLDSLRQWYSSDEYVTLRERAGLPSPTGCGEATLTASATGHWSHRDTIDQESIN